MPAPRSVLADIHDLGLDPKVPHKDVSASGRIKPPVVAKPAADVPVAVASDESESEEKDSEESETSASDTENPETPALDQVKPTQKRRTFKR